MGACTVYAQQTFSSPYIEASSVYIAFMTYEEDDGGRSLLQRELKSKGSRDATRQDPCGSGKGGLDPLRAGRRRATTEDVEVFGNSLYTSCMILLGSRSAVEIQHCKQTFPSG